MNKFCVITPGRSGSTSLMKVIEDFNDVAVPNKNIDCPNNELVHPRFIKKYTQQYAELTQSEIKTKRDLIQHFYDYNRSYDYVGFKTMPLRHSDTLEFLKREDIKFIVLVRDDIPSTVASFIAARKRDTWSRTGGNIQKKLTIRGFDKLLVWGNIRYLRDSLRMLKRIPNPIHITYENLCDPGYSNSNLDDFFRRSIKLNNPVSPTSGEDYVEDWDAFKKFVKRWL